MIMNSELVSICVPAYNSAAYIKRTINSILRQSYENIELVVVDDNSTDNTVEIVRSIKDDRLRLICNEENLGMTGNWNRCVRECRGEYVKLVPADDLISRHCIEKSMEAFKNNSGASLVIVDTKLIDNDDNTVGSYAHWPFSGRARGGLVAKASVMLNNFWGNPVCALFRKKDFETVGGFDSDIPYILDFDLWLGLSRLGDTIFIKECLSAFRVRKDSNTGVLIGSGGRDYTAEHVRLLDKHAELGTYKLSSPERWLSITWRALRNYIIAFYIKVKSK